MCVTLVANTADWLDFPQLCSHWPILIILGFIVKHCFFLVQMSSLQEALLQFSVAYLFSGGGTHCRSMLSVQTRWCTHYAQSGGVRWSGEFDTSAAETMLGWIHGTSSCLSLSEATDSSCVCIAVLYKIKAIFPKFQQTTLAICRCFDWTAWSA